MLTVEYDVPGSASFDRGDCNEDSGVDIADGIEVLEFVFGGSVVLECSDACDCNDDGEIDIADAIYVLSALFVPGAPLPAPPFTSCGFDPTIDGLDCTQFAACP